MSKEDSPRRTWRASRESPQQWRGAGQDTDAHSPFVDPIPGYKAKNAPDSRPAKLLTMLLDYRGKILVIDLEDDLEGVIGFALEDIGGSGIDLLAGAAWGLERHFPGDFDEEKFCVERLGIDGVQFG